MGIENYICINACLLISCKIMSFLKTSKQKGRGRQHGVCTKGHLPLHKMEVARKINYSDVHTHTLFQDYEYVYGGGRYQEKVACRDGLR